jgi:threonine/homoserine/homoserine lactone efflux protein
MAPYVLIGATYAFAAAAQPGQLQVYFVSQALAHGWQRTLPAALAPLLSDVPIIAVVLVVLTTLPPWLLDALRVVGGCFLLWLAVAAFNTWRHHDAGAVAWTDGPPRTLLRAVLVNLLNPNPYLGWSLVMGPLLLEAWNTEPAYAVVFVAVFYTTMVSVSAAIIIAFAAARSLGPRVARALVGVSAAALAGFGLYQLWTGSSALLRLGDRLA